MEKILFVLKERFYSYSKTSYGLINSATLLAEFLEREGYDCKVVTVIDGNFIDKEVTQFKPNIVIIEALWVPTYKLKELIELKKYKKIKWIVRVHSDIGFLSCETQALKFVNEYEDLHKDNLVIAFNNKKFVDVLSDAMRERYAYLPNVVTLQIPEVEDREERNHIDIACFGATRLLKNQCFQAMCAIKAADLLGKTLRFHVTPNLDQGNDPILANLKELFKNNRHELIIHDWLPNNEFQKLIQEMDIGMQVSYTESFNIVSADFINNCRLILVSDAIDWLPPILRTSTIDYEETTRKIIYLYKHRNSGWLKEISRSSLREYNRHAEERWRHFLHKHYHIEHGK